MFPPIKPPVKNEAIFVSQPIGFIANAASFSKAMVQTLAAFVSPSIPPIESIKGCINELATLKNASRTVILIASNAAVTAPFTFINDSLAFVICNNIGPRIFAFLRFDVNSPNLVIDCANAADPFSVARFSINPCISESHFCSVLIAIKTPSIKRDMTFLTAINTAATAPATAATFASIASLLFANTFPLPIRSPGTPVPPKLSGRGGPISP